ncbi:endonuclease domain-containing protein [Pedobacter sp. SYSU D00535]|uniref:endonuclease domain-containing protein n=1 Tax=Pedobacter sp. SYSU D00535 TaxID=2810308 RepID=UPI001A97A15C|nr:DUF559 domain-containing protein [Pedobacter sp. SYSU D00535]
MKPQQPDQFNYYNSNLQPFAYRLRREMTKAEACLWKYALKGRKLNGVQFRRQRPVLNYIADFMCQELELIIEVDGWTHTLQEVADKDEERQKNLEAAGFTVLRFSDEEVLQDINKVIWAIEDKVAELRNKDQDL